MKLSVGSPVVFLLGPPVARSVSAVFAIRPVALVPPAPVELSPRRVGPPAPSGAARERRARRVAAALP